MMCGIYGLARLSGAPLPDAGLLDRMGDIMRHRGPDDHGKFVDADVMLGMRRLSIIDVAGGRQPLANEDKTVWVVCNGEIYNFQSLRERLRQQGHVFRSQSDSEVIVHLYEQYGDEFILHADGMFGFALWDTRRRRLLIGRDRLGIKPIYYANNGDQLIFASEIKSILWAPGITAQLDPIGLREYLTLGYCPTPYSLFRGIKKLPPASLITCDAGQYRISRYWELPDDIDESLSEAEWIRRTREQLEASVASQMVSDVPMGSFLSGGIDSSAVVAMMSRHSQQPVKTYAIGFADSSGGNYYNELPYARQVAELFKTDHQEIVVQPDVARLLPALIWHMDEPIADAAFVTTYLVAQFARREVTVILSGVGGDELFGGYRRYLGEYYGRQYNRLPRWFRRGVVAPIAQRLPSDRHSRWLDLSRYARRFILANELSFEERYRAYVQVFSRQQLERLRTAVDEVEESDCLGQALRSTDGHDEIYRMFRADLATQLPDDLLYLTDKMSMAVSLECRVPLLDTALVELSAKMPSSLKIRGRNLKFILKEALSDVLPHEILYRKKRGFGAPMGAWLKDELSGFLHSVLSREAVEGRGLFNWDVVEATIALHDANKEDHTDHLLSLVNLELWCRLYLDGMSVDDVRDQIESEVVK
jgi:asparagine synthase (glutamine-hydrolysing)